MLFIFVSCCNLTKPWSPTQHDDLCQVQSGAYIWHCDDKEAGRSGLWAVQQHLKFSLTCVVIAHLEKWQDWGLVRVVMEGGWMFICDANNEVM